MGQVQNIKKTKQRWIFFYNCNKSRDFFLSRQLSKFRFQNVGAFVVRTLFSNM